MKLSKQLMQLSEPAFTANDYRHSTTLSMLQSLLDFMAPLSGKTMTRILDVGCGFGGLTSFLGNMFRGEEIHGVDIDSTVHNEASSKGLIVHCLDAEVNDLPFPENYFDLILSFGFMEHIACWDVIIRNMHRVLAPEGFCLLGLRNLASWSNRLSLLLGYQLVDIEISRNALVGIRKPSSYGIIEDKTTVPRLCVHSTTIRAFTEFMEYNGFRTIDLKGCRPHPKVSNLPFKILDSVLSQRVSLARRFFYLGAKADVNL
jgi:SAM-dependent methyltransferase